MKSKLFAVIIAFLMMFSVFAQTHVPVAEGGGYYPGGPFMLSDDLATYLNLTPTQVNAINRQYLLLNYDWGITIEGIMNLDQKIYDVQNDMKLSPREIGVKVEGYVELKISLARDLIAEIMANNKALLKLLDAKQQSALLALDASAKVALKVLNAAYSAYTGNFLLTDYTVGSLTTGGGCRGGCGGTTENIQSAEQTEMTIINGAIISAVEKERTRRSLNK